MAFHYVGGARDQLFLLPMSMRDWLDEGHLAWFVLDSVAAIDTSAFHARHPNDGPGRPAYDPDMMLALLLYGYGTGVRSSRRIEALCRTDAAFRVIAGDVVPDHATIARFLVDHERAIEDSFFEVLRLCAAAGLVSVGTIAIDGTKMAADASLRANRSRAAIEAELARLRAEARRIVAEARAVDATEDTQADLFASDRLPADLSTRAGRRARLEQALALIEAEEAAARADAAERAAKARDAAAEGRRLTGKKPKDPNQALERAEIDAEVVKDRVQGAAADRTARRAARQAQAAAEGRTLRGRPPVDLPAKQRRDLERAEQAVTDARAALDAAPGQAHKAEANVTDPDSRIMKTVKGWVQGYNAQAGVNDHQIVVACLLSQDANDVGLYQPMVSAVHAALARIGVNTPIGTVLADAGYWSEDNATAEGPDRLIATLKDWKQRQAARELGTTSGPPPPQATPLDAMEHRLRTPEGAQAYSHRSYTVEPVFGDSKHNRGFPRFRRRGLPAARSEWSLINSVHNLLKLFHHPPQTTPALA
jgi:transposase